MQKDRAEPDSYAAGQTYIGITENNLTEVSILEEDLLEQILAPPNLNQAYKKVKSNKGKGGVDKMEVDSLKDYLVKNKEELLQSIRDGKLRANPVRRVEIHKEKGKLLLGLPTVVDKVIQQAISQVLSPVYEQQFLPSSYGFRPGKNAHQALKKCREHITDGYIYAVDMDLQQFFDTVNHSKLVEILSRTIKDGRVISLIHKYLQAGVVVGNKLEETKLGVPQGSPIGPILANLFMHYTFDLWMKKRFSHIPFERFADDCICHFRTKEEAEYMYEQINARMAQCGLALNEEKTKIVYCKDDDRRGSYKNEQFDFLGFTFRARRSKNRYGKFFINFSPAISKKAITRIGREIRSWKLHLRSDKTLEDLARMFNARLQGFINYYGKFYRSAMYPLFQRLNFRLAHWISRKFKRYKRRKTRAVHLLGKICSQNPTLFAHWRLGVRPPKML